VCQRKDKNKQARSGLTLKGLKSKLTAQPYQWLGLHLPDVFTHFSSVRHVVVVVVVVVVVAAALVV
jgi:hypothetical protein